MAMAKSAGTDATPRNRVAFFATIFLSAFLLFQVQLIVAKQLLPWFGGTAAVWNTCLVFFQLLLLAGYAYSHWASTRLGATALTRAHMGLLTLSVCALLVCALVWRSPVYPGNSFKPQNPAYPVLDLFFLLLVSVGLPFFLLSTTGPLIQNWFAHTHPETSPYRLYSLSNLGSLLGLLTYPVLVEPNLSLRNQGRVWTLLYFLFVAGCTASALAFARHEPAETTPALSSSEDSPAERPSFSLRMLWLGLAACGCVMLLSVTNLICQEIAVVPFLWVLPLAIYLISFVLCFHHRPIYRRGPFHALFAISAAWGGILFLSGEHVKVVTQIEGFSLLLFACCMVYHGELVRLKPSPRYLTSFYLHIACGGALGSAFVGLIAPAIFPAIWEFQLGLWASGLLLGAVLVRDKSSWLHDHPRWLLPALCLGITAVADYIGVAVTILHTDPAYVHFLVAAFAVWTVISVFSGPRTRSGEPGWLQAAALCGWCLFGLLFWVQARRQASHSVLMTRNFYGVLRVEYDEPIAERHALLEKHGLTLHGAQLQDPRFRRLPTIYYGPNSGIGLLLLNHPNYSAAGPGHLRIGVIGLGVGTIAAYGRPGDSIRFYEMNPDVVRLAQGKDARFTFLNDSPAKIDVVMGDGRISLERELASGHAQNLDVLAIDAFSSDSIPLHLLTREAMDTYLRHLRGAQSILAFHISNRALDLRPVLVGLAQQHQLHLIRVFSTDVQNETELPSDWVLMAADPAAFDIPALKKKARAIDLSGTAPSWTDDYSNLLQVLR